MMSNLPPKPIVLCVLDGFGYREEAPDNATTKADMPVWRKLWALRPHALLEASGEDVGLPVEQMGNSEVGHMNLGAGRVVYQDLPMIDRALDAGELGRNPSLIAFIEKLMKSGGACHLMGLASPGGVHAHMRHILALADMVASAGVRVFVHAFLDGRDVPPQSAIEYVAEMDHELKSIKNAMLATLCGRYYAMDRDKRWERVERAYNLLAIGDGARVSDPVRAVEASYVDGIYDEFVLPIVCGSYNGMNDGDGVLFANFRADRAREILSALLMPNFNGFARHKVIHFDAALGMVEYSSELNEKMATMFPPKEIANNLGSLVAAAGLKQLRIAETEKYPHVTFFFNGGREEPYAGEDRMMIPSPKVATYDLKPEMSAIEVTDKVVEAIQSGKYSFIIINYANPDMVGHTGSLKAAVWALQTVDTCLGRLLEALEVAGGAALITADHGNCEMMTDAVVGGPHTAHTLSKVPVVIVHPSYSGIVRDGRLADVAPTLLRMLCLDQPSEMTGESLIAL
jgi:2,3-bisphosphoglycerate-independent phosphoglycerate mutase